MGCIPKIALKQKSQAIIFNNWNQSIAQPRVLMRTRLETHLYCFKREVKKKRCVFTDQRSSEVNQWLVLVALEKLISLNFEPWVRIKIAEAVEHRAVVGSADALCECICALSFKHVVEQPHQRQTFLVNFAATVSCITNVESKLDELNHQGTRCRYSINFILWFPYCIWRTFLQQIFIINNRAFLC